MSHVLETRALCPCAYNQVNKNWTSDQVSYARNCRGWGGISVVQGQLNTSLALCAIGLGI